ncbi:MAG: GNAT family N-acetyltransferase [Methanoregula sp.]|jgi:ribosomal protein S18 acetylase RimI-like enzyme|uniref:GNAT family N-acetyltransferase n=1 Tax=Methanoregula sp. TaxID=2052170 RepID=UPI0025F4E535|nr:GNAT family N-acetyltransferase [Methanoregula sp.]MCK9631439.1 GNAT family N-acetyltransferase [Methanoregula sp.]
MEGTVVIRIVDAWDQEEIVHLYRAGGWWKDGYDPGSLHDLIRGSFAFAVAIDIKTGHAIGMGRVLSDGISDGYIQDLVVLPEYRKQGIGKEIVTALVGHCTRAGISWIGLIAEPGTESFYQPLGFQPMKGHIPLLWTSDRPC